jgi:hypothetical protein
LPFGQSPAAVPTGIAAAQSVPIGDLGSYVGARVTIGGEVVAVQTGEVSIDDGTGAATVVASSAAAETLSTASIGDLLNATGTVATTGAGFELVVEDEASLTLLDLTSPTFGASSTSASASPRAVAAGIAAPTGGLTPDSRLIALALLALSVVAVGVAFMASPYRRQWLRDRLTNASIAVKQRLDALRSS